MIVFETELIVQRPERLYPVKCGRPKGKCTHSIWINEWFIGSFFSRVPLRDPTPTLESSSIPILAIVSNPIEWHDSRYAVWRRRATYNLGINWCIRKLTISTCDSFIFYGNAQVKQSDMREAIRVKNRIAPLCEMAISWPWMKKKKNSM